VVRDLPWTVEKLRVIPPFEFENWAVIALGGIPNKVQVGDIGVDGRIYPVSSAATPRKKQEGELALKERWYPRVTHPSPHHCRSNISRSIRSGSMHRGLFDWEDFPLPAFVADQHHVAGMETKYYGRSTFKMED
jgi:hypothetical protein